MQKTLAQTISSLIQAKANCDRSGNAEWFMRHGVRLNIVCREYLPSGSGIDAGTRLDPASRHDRLIFNTEFHHMNDAGMYDGWTQHRVIVTPAFDGFDIRVTGSNRNDVRDYLADVFRATLESLVQEESRY